MVALLAAVVQSVTPSGELVLNWTALDASYDGILAAGMVPYVEIDFMPSLLANGTTTYLHYKANVTPPKNLTQWHMVRGTCGWRGLSGLDASVARLLHARKGCVLASPRAVSSAHDARLSARPHTYTQQHS